MQFVVSDSPPANIYETLVRSIVERTRPTTTTAIPASPALLLATPRDASNGLFEVCLETSRPTVAQTMENERTALLSNTVDLEMLTA